MAALDAQLHEKERAEQTEFDARLRSRERAAVAGLEVELQARTVPVLKDGLRARGLPLKGRKADLVRRLARARVKDGEGRGPGAGGSPGADSPGS